MSPHKQDNSEINDGGKSYFGSVIFRVACMSVGGSNTYIKERLVCTIFDNFLAVLQRAVIFS